MIGELIEILESADVLAMCDAIQDRNWCGRIMCSECAFNNDENKHKMIAELKEKTQ